MCITNKKTPRRDKFVESRFIVEKLLQNMNPFKGNYDRSPRRSRFEHRPEHTVFVADKMIVGLLSRYGLMSIYGLPTVFPQLIY